MKEIKKCWNCPEIVTINEYGYALCRCGKYSIGDRRGYKVLGITETEKLRKYNRDSQRRHRAKL